jgi:hypothetical protein
MPMTEKNFDEAFLSRLTLAMRAIKQAAPNANDPEPLQAEDYEAIYTAYAESGGDAAVAKNRIAAARAQCTQALGRILQYIADQYGAGPVERLDDPALADIARDAFDATENWLDEVAMLDRTVAPRNPLQAFLETHYRLNEAMLELHDHILWPIARRISPTD